MIVEVVNIVQSNWFFIIAHFFLQVDGLMEATEALLKNEDQLSVFENPVSTVPKGAYHADPLS